VLLFQPLSPCLSFSSGPRWVIRDTDEKNGSESWNEEENKRTSIVGYDEKGVGGTKYQNHTQNQETVARKWKEGIIYEI